MDDIEFVLGLLDVVTNMGGNVVPTAPAYRLVLDQYGITCDLPVFIEAVRAAVGPGVHIGRCEDYPDAYLATTIPPTLFGFYWGTLHGKRVLQFTDATGIGALEYYGSLVNEWNTAWTLASEAIGLGTPDACRPSDIGVVSGSERGDEAAGMPTLFAREELFERLRRFNHAQLDTMIVKLSLDSSFLPGREAPVATRAAALLDMVTHPDGPGLAALKARLDEINTR
jgi:hypothetical protein